MSFQLKLPLVRSSARGFLHIEEVMQSVGQDFRSLLLTIPGEKINDPDFGIGLQKFIFEQNDPIIQSEIKNTILEKTGRYLPFINIVDIEFFSQENNLFISIKYFVGSPNNIDQVILALSGLASS